MCRSISEGGRRCPCSRGDRRRAYQRHRYAARKAAGEFRSTHTVGGVDTPPVVDPDSLPTSAQIAAMTSEQRAEVRAAAVKRMKHTTEVVLPETRNAVAEEWGMTYEQYEALWFSDPGGMRGLPDSDSAAMGAYVGITEELGRDVSICAETLARDRMEAKGLDDATVKKVMDEFAERFQDQDIYEASALYGERLRAGELDDGTSDRIFALENELRDVYYSKKRSPKISSLSFTDDEFRELIQTRYGPVAVDPRRVQAALYDPEVHRTFDDAPQWPTTAKEYARLRHSLNESTAVRNCEVRRAVYSRGINDMRRIVHAQAFRDALSEVQSFGNEKVEPQYTSAVTKAMRAEFDDAVSVFPDAMVAQARDGNHDLLVRKTRARAHFCEARYAKTPGGTSRDRYLNLDLRDMDPSKPEGFRYAYKGWSAGEDGAPSPHHYANTPENRERLETFVRMVNEGKIRNTVTRGNGWNSKPLKLVVDLEGGGEDGAEPYLVVKTEAPIKSTDIRKVAELTTDGSADTTIHELGHYMESTPQVSALCKRFLHDRTQGCESKVYHRSRKHGVEMCTPDGFANEYIGKDYRGRASTEVFSMGMEGIFAAGRGGIRGLNEPTQIDIQGNPVEYDGVVDTGHRNLVLGILAGFDPSHKPMTRDRAAKVLDDWKTNADEDARIALQEKIVALHIIRPTG